ncbi:MAG: FKBP-type peptidyl-prolyl cis-trans isomerase [Actinomycetota bacterium]|nr:FKBP-type peptidyl-prolyl cis-trans isomerase [Actinomycetota bacterium]
MADAATVNNGDTVQVHYTGRLDDGRTFDSSQGRDPLQFVVGSGQVISGFDQAVSGLAVGDTRSFRIEPDDGYGDRRDDLVLKVPQGQAPDGLTVGDQVQVNNTPATVIDVDDAGVTIDANHPLAGHALNFDIQVVGIAG